MSLLNRSYFVKAHFFIFLPCRNKSKNTTWNLCSLLVAGRSTERPSHLRHATSQENMHDFVTFRHIALLLRVCKVNALLLSYFRWVACPYVHLSYFGRGSLLHSFSICSAKPPTSRRLNPGSQIYQLPRDGPSDMLLRLGTLSATACAQSHQTIFREKLTSRLHTCQRLCPRKRRPSLQLWGSECAIQIRLVNHLVKFPNSLAVVYLLLLHLARCFTGENSSAPGNGWRGGWRPGNLHFMNGAHVALLLTLSLLILLSPG